MRHGLTVLAHLLHASLSIIFLEVLRVGYCLVMRMLLVDGFTQRNGLIDLVGEELQNRGHKVTVLNLCDEGFKVSMTEHERNMYHDSDNLVSIAQRRSAELVKNIDGLVICYEMKHGLFPSQVKSWFERVFIPGVSFVINDKGRIQRALTNLRMVGVVSLAEPGHGHLPWRNDPSRSLVRAVRMNAHIFCAMRLVHLSTSDDLKSIREALRSQRW